MAGEDEREARFAAALEECRSRLRRGEALEDSLAACPPEHREEIARLLPLTSRLERLGHDPSATFQSRLEIRLLAALDERRRGQHHGPLARLRGLVAVAPARRFASLALAALIVVAGSGLGAVYAAEDSLPDSPLYQVKEARERVELALARDTTAQVGVRTRLIDQRSRELEGSVRQAKPGPVAQAIARRLVTSTRRMVDQALELRAQGRPAPAVRALATVRALERRLDQLAAEASPDLQPLLGRLRAFLEQQERRLLAGGATVYRQS